MLTRLQFWAGCWWPILASCCLLLFGHDALCADARESEPRWYKGNLHAHSFWSDGDDFPEMVANWYKRHGYHFLALTDHDGLMQGDRWVKLGGHDGISPPVLEKYRSRFGGDWIQISTAGQIPEAKLKTFAEIQAKLAEPDKFLMIQGEEIYCAAGSRHVYINALNLSEVIFSKPRTTATEAISAILETTKEQAKRLQRPILANVNHPYYDKYDVAPEELAKADGLQFFEVSNQFGAAIHTYGDLTHPSVERLWDIANTIRIAKMKCPPLYGLGSDDAHNYHLVSPQRFNPGRGWIMVRAKKLTADDLIEAMNRGDFYASTGVALRKIDFDRRQRLIRVEVKPALGVNYTIEFIGTLEGVDPAGQPLETVANKGDRPGCTYSPELGKVLAMVKGTSARYHLTGKELYVRAVVRSDKPLVNAPTGGVQKQEAWCQPMGWEDRVRL